mmetsp:Transcript_10640/g.16290  ORF Transcript_10640/g.16290 Transcript_10640/m.16290 type:complete len:481 (-) Transcript_10640:327-1769(-)|eukprot:CAMPEP_0178916706 /NCGR_PEP_ID=MMETSP0786-20121207/12807_1 /TAXON_ID=186022 /ORGANISM="Thalassionema frauenfeldii, Strain CCMP 1798" /LENGTH=480 /DNA_ID=CAMNT_0020590109 /DNA_START=265 /DNA_END=1707 /DNA_ORIENTATION=-
MMEEAYPEQLALIGFAARLGTSVCREDVVTDDKELRSEAQLLMSLLSSNPISAAPDNVKESKIERIRPFYGEEPSYEDTCSIADESASFSFSCPSLSLDGIEHNSRKQDVPRERSDSNESEESIPPLVSSTAPVISMSRRLVVDDRDALRLSAEAMARNILNTFQKAILWRKRCWVEALSRPLVAEEKRMKKSGATEDELRALLETPAALVISSLNQSQIEVLDARTSFRVLPHIWKQDEDNITSRESKKRKLTRESNTDKTVTAYVLSFQTVLNFCSPCGYSQVTLDAPGVIEGTFSNCHNEGKLTGVSVEIDTKILASMIERSSRIIARASAESFMNSDVDSEQEEVSDSCEVENTPYTATPEVDKFSPTIVTPRNKSPEITYCDGGACSPPLPCDLETESHERAVLRMVSPQPRCAPSNESISFKSPIVMSKTMPSLVSPDPKASASGDTQFLTFGSKPGPSLPALVEVACAAMQTS